MSAAAQLLRRPWVPPVVLAIGALIVFGVHFRPWEGGLLEEWAIANDWNRDGGWSVLAGYVQWMLSRPLHLLPTLFGLALGGGEPAAIFFVIGLVAVGQFLFVVWALRPVSRSFWLSTAVAFAFALHPLWPAGLLQRFLPAQTAVLALIIAMGLLIRWLKTGRARWLIGAVIALLVGFAVYPGPAVVAPLMALAIALAVQSTWRRRFLAVVATTGASALMTLYSIVIVRLVSPSGSNSYELSNIDQAAVKSIRELVQYVGFTLVGQGQLLILAVIGVGILAAVLALTGAVPHWAGWLMLGVAAVSPACAIVFFGSTAWLQDIDRLGYTTSLALMVALCLWPITSSGRRPRLEAVLAGLLVLATAAGAVHGIAKWQPFVAVQHQLLTALGPVVEEAGEGEVVVVVDRSGTFGQLYTFPLQYLGPASKVMNRDLSPVWLCFDESSPHPIPAGGVVCDPADTGTDLRREATLELPGGDVDIYIGQLEAHD